MAQPLTPPYGELRVVEDVTSAFADVVVESFSRRGGDVFSLVLSGGDTARRCYLHLAASLLDWGQVEVLVGDERCVAPEDPQSNQRLIRESLLDRVGPVRSFHPMVCDDIDSYVQILDGFGEFDLVHLGMGPDGHTASLFPTSPHLEAPEDCSVVKTHDPTGQNPFERMTLTFHAISRARAAVFTLEGEDLRPAFEQLCSGADLPAARVRAKNLLWLVSPEVAA